MKLRNKKTGEVIDLDIANIKAQFGGISVIPEPVKLGGVEYVYNSLAQLNEEWEDYNPNRSLIEDKKIRKAVRAWAEANGIGGCICKEEIHCVTFETERGMFISFENADPIPPEGNFTIDELCGKEEK